jgi:hypothetical protein
MLHDLATFNEVAGMIYRTRTKTRETRTGSLLRMTARYIGSCLCGALIEPGDTIQYDTLDHMTLCCDCGRRRSEAKASNLQIVEQPSECQQIIDSYRQLQALPSPLEDGIHSEMQSLLHRLVQDFSTISEARKFIASLADCIDDDPDFVAIRAKYKGPCAHCETVINAGQLCLYDRNSRRLHCIPCDCQKFNFRTDAADHHQIGTTPIQSSTEVDINASTPLPASDFQINASEPLASADADVSATLPVPCAVP